MGINIISRYAHNKKRVGFQSSEFFLCGMRVLVRFLKGTHPSDEVGGLLGAEAVIPLAADDLQHQNTEAVDIGLDREEPFHGVLRRHVPAEAFDQTS